MRIPRHIRKYQGGWAALPAILPMIESAAATTAIGYGISKLTAPSMPHINVPPPPGAGMISQAGQQAASDQRRRAAAGGGLQSTIEQGAQGGATSASKSLLGS